MPQVNVAEMLYECKVIHLNVAEMPLDVGLLPKKAVVKISGHDDFIYDLMTAIIAH